MKTALICGTCGVSVEVCEDCGGKYCTDGCMDRLEDGCVCMLDDDDRDE